MALLKRLEAEVRRVQELKLVVKGSMICPCSSYTSMAPTADCCGGYRRSGGFAKLEVSSDYCQVGHRGDHETVDRHFQSMQAVECG